MGDQNSNLIIIIVTEVVEKQKAMRSCVLMARVTEKRQKETNQAWTGGRVSVRVLSEHNILSLYTHFLLYITNTSPPSPYCPLLSYSLFSLSLLHLLPF